MTPPAPVIVALVDDHPGVRRGLQLTLHLHGFACRVYASAEGFLSSSQIDDVACLLLDVRMPGMSGLELQQRLAEEHRGIPIILITADPDPAIEVNARLSGAAGFFSKSAAPHILVAGIRKAIAGAGTNTGATAPAPALLAGVSLESGE